MRNAERIPIKSGGAVLQPRVVRVYGGIQPSILSINGINFPHHQKGKIVSNSVPNKKAIELGLAEQEGHGANIP